MKKSQMLEMIEDFMEQNNEDPILTKQEAAEAFLRFVESKGMLPPLNDWSLHTDGDKADVDNVRYYTWESEE